MVSARSAQLYISALLFKSGETSPLWRSANGDSIPFDFPHSGSTSNLISNLYFGLDKFSAINSNADISRKRNIEVNRWVYWIIYDLIKIISCVHHSCERGKDKIESSIDIFNYFLATFVNYTRERILYENFFYSPHIGMHFWLLPPPPFVSYGWGWGLHREKCILLDSGARPRHRRTIFPKRIENFTEQDTSYL